MSPIFLRVFAAFFLIPASVIGSLFWLDHTGFFNLERIDVVIEGGEEQSAFMKPLAEDLRGKLQKFRGESLWDLDLPEISMQLKAKGWIRNIALSRNWPKSLNVIVSAKEVELLYLSKAGGLFPIVTDGSFLDPVTSKSAPDVTLLEGEIFEKNLEMRRKAVKTLTSIPDSGLFSRKNISELRYDSKEGFWMTLIRSGIKVKMGEENISLKAARVSQVLEYVENRKLEARVIDANLSKKVLVRLRKDP